MPARRLAVLVALAALAGCGPGEERSQPARPLSSAAHAVSTGTPRRPTERPVPQRTSTPASLSPVPSAQATEAGRAEPVYRPDDDRPLHDDAALTRAGILRYESRRLVLYTDIDPDLARSIPPLVDALYADLTGYFGDLPPSRDGAEFQITGYLMREVDRFQAAGLVPDDLPTFHHGRHRGRRFWMRDQEFDYYRRHLLLHEATHCFMTLLPRSDGPVWYMEGMAEHFGTHRLEGGPRFRVMPTSPDEFAGLGRITLVRQAIAVGSYRALESVFALRPGEYLDNSAYGWSWAACHFLDTHPRYRERFRELGDPLLRERLGKEFTARFGAESRELAVDWAHFTHTLRYGYELEHAAIEHRHGEPRPAGGTSVRIEADRGWQSAGIQVTAGNRYAIAADGQFSVANVPKDWISTADGISFDYFEGRPLGRLLAAVLAEESAAAADPAHGLLTPIDIGREAILEPPASGTLYLRINDRWDRLSDNSGSLSVSVKQLEH